MFFRASLRFGFGKDPEEEAEKYEEYRDLSSAHIEREEFLMGFQPNEEGRQQ